MMFFAVNYTSIVLFAVLSAIVFVVPYMLMRKKVKKQVYGVGFLVWFLVGIALLWSGFFGKYVNTVTINTHVYTQKELARDLKQLEKYLLKDNPLYFADREQLQQMFSNAYLQLGNGMTELEFYRLVNPIVAAVKCGHTNLLISDALERNRQNTAAFFPLLVTLVGNQIFITEDDPVTGILAGDEIVSINGRSSAEIISILLQNINGDGDFDTKRRYIISKHFNHKYYDFVDDSESFHVLFRRDRVIKTADLSARYRKEFNTNAWQLHFAEYQAGKYYESRMDNDYAVLTIHFFRNDKNMPFDKFLSEFFAEVRVKKINKLVIDVRGNYGGDSFMTKELLSYLSENKFDYFDGELGLLFRLLGFTKPVTPQEDVFAGDVVVLTDGACFSTTAHFCALVKYHGLATLVGSETGGTYVCTDASKMFVLRNTQLRLNCSTKTFPVLAAGISEKGGIKPDNAVSLTIGDILQKRDPVMDAGLKVLEVR